MSSTRPLIAVALVAWMLSVSVGTGAAAVAAPADAGSPADGQQLAVDAGPTYVQSPCYIDGDADPDCLCEDGEPVPCDEAEQPEY